MKVLFKNFFLNILGLFAIILGMVSMLYIPIATTERLMHYGWSPLSVALFLTTVIIWSWLLGPMIGIMTKIWGEIYGSKKTRDN